MSNPLVNEWSTPFEMPPFELLSDDDFMPAFDRAIELYRDEIDAIATNQSQPTFGNTIDQFERSGAELERIAAVFFTICATDSTPEREAMQRDLSPRLAALSAEVLMNTNLFARIDSLWLGRDGLELSLEQARVLELTHRQFVRSGARLEADKRDALKSIGQELARLGTKFTQNLLADERAWYMRLSDDDLEQLPEFVVNAARGAGAEHGLDYPVVTLSRSLITPFMQHSPNRTLRQQAYDAFCARGANGGETDNLDVAKQILHLREQRANLLGYNNFSEFKLETQMAKHPTNVRDLLMKVWGPARSAAERDAKILTAMLHEDGHNGALEPWDWHYYAERRREAEHDLEEAEVKPYLQLENMFNAALYCAERLFGLAFEKLELPLHHADAQAYEVRKDGRHIGVFITDYFARSTKRSGAWCSDIRAQQKLVGDIRPIVINVCNFVKPEAGHPALLSWDDLRTLFHEFGHALHQLLSDVTYPSISGTSVARDFVELPSQLFEHWAEVPEVLEKFAIHAETGDPIPEALVCKLLAATTHDMGAQTVEFLSSAIVDLDLHEGAAPEDIMAAQSEALTRIGMPSALRMRHAVPHFAHIFAGDGYSSGYYSYLWSEVMDADAFEAFVAAGDPFDTHTAQKLEEHILSKGGSEDAEVLYTKFRGTLPDITALLKGRGLVSAP